ncbi:hypothetical protein SAY86_015969 [Trapa natans]|uniref:Squamosa promoter-binding-like protein 14 n=1 Tax=Trapa natans TaxID=22666 RepID=A0AAN7LKM0_TRANT|nr:hypothetical protein SAY86_015969 [Trapa natans]
MEEAGAQVATPTFIHVSPSNGLWKSSLLAQKRDYPYNHVQSHNFQPQDLQSSLDPRANWNPNSWEWDSTQFIARPIRSDILGLTPVTTEKKRRGEEGANGIPVVLSSSSGEDEGDESLRLDLGGSLKSLEGPISRPNKRAEEASSRILSPGTFKDSNCDANRDVVNLLTAFAHTQGQIEDKGATSSPIPDKEQILQILSKINALGLPVDLAAGLSSFGNLNGASSGHPLSPSDNPFKSNGEISSPSTVNLLTALSATMPSQKNGQNLDFEKSIVNKYSDQSADPNCPTTENNSTGGERSSSSYHSSVKDSDCHVLEARKNLPLQLFSSSPENCSPPKLPPSRKYYSSGSSNRTEDQSPSSSPVVQRLFPLRTPAEEATRPEITAIREVHGYAEMNSKHIVPLQLFRDHDRDQEQTPYQSSPNQTGSASSSGSDHSPSSLSLDSQYQQDRTGRIMFKLFDRGPSHLPGALRSQIYSWLSNSPVDMESYIRPGCLVLSIYLSMPSTAWQQLEENLPQHLNTLLQAPDSDFWKTGRFLVSTGQKLASQNDGKTRLLKSWRTSSPELLSVSPLAVAVGQEISQLVLKGRNLVNPGTRIHCTYMGRYMSKDVPEECSRKKPMYEEVRIQGFGINDIVAVPDSTGRCFLEVENGLKGNSFPLIIADATICRELQLLESELTEDKNSRREEVLHFLNELGWLFQRKKDSSPLDPSNSLRRFKFLLTFSIERDWCYLVRKLLDMLVENSTNGGISGKDSLEVLAEVQLLSHAVRRGCIKMVEMLIEYAVDCGPNASRMYIFPPNMAGPGGITPLHLAACISGAADMVNALTNDPQEIGLNSWSTLLDGSWQTPGSYAAMRNNSSYNELVAGKLTDRRNGQVSLSIRGSETTTEVRLRSSSSCAQCSAATARHYYGPRIARSQGVLHRPYIHSMLVVAAVCVCVCLFLRGAPKVGLVAPFKWENLDYGPI